MKHRVNFLINEYEIRDKHKIKMPFQSGTPHSLSESVFCSFSHSNQLHILFCFLCSKHWEFYHRISGNELEFILHT